MQVMAHLKAFIILKANTTSDLPSFHFLSSVIEKLDVLEKLKFSFSCWLEKLEISFEPQIRKSLKMASKIGFLQAKPEPPTLNPLVRVWCEQRVMRNSLAC